MKNIISICLFVLCFGFLASCNGVSNGNSENSSITKEKDSVAMLNEELEVPDSVTLSFYYYERSKLRFLLSDFIKNNPDCFNNEIAMETYSEELKKKLDEAIQKDSTFIMDLVVTYDEIITQDAINKETGGQAYIIGCKSGTFGQGYDSNDKYGYKVEYTVIGGVSKEEMIKLKNNTDYKITGVISSRVDEDYIGNKFGITGKYGKNINLGCFFIKDLKFEEV